MPRSYRIANYPHQERVAARVAQVGHQITEHRSPGRPLPHPRTGKLADFLLTHQGRRVSAHALRGELHRAAAEAGLAAKVRRHEEELRRLERASRQPRQ